MGACSQSDIEPVSDVSGGTRAPQDKIIVFQKVVQTGDEQVPATAGQFKFELWGEKDGPTFFGIYTTDENGKIQVEFSDLNGKDYYYFTEVFDTPEEAAQWETLPNQRFFVDPSQGAQWDEYDFFAFGPEGPTIVNIPAEPEVPELGEPYESVTLTNDANDPKVYPGTNHFNYAVLSASELAEGVTLDMVVGNGNTKVGEAFVKLVDGAITIAIDGVGTFGGFAVTELPVDKNPNSLIEHNNEPIVCPEGDVIYLYVHFDPVQFYL